MSVGVCGAGQQRRYDEKWKRARRVLDVEVAVRDAAAGDGLAVVAIEADVGALERHEADGDSRLEEADEDNRRGKRQHKQAHARSNRRGCHMRSLRRRGDVGAPHLLYVLSGRMKIVMADGTEGEIGPGDAAHIAPGHDARGRWVTRRAWLLTSAAHRPTQRSSKPKIPVALVVCALSRASATATPGEATVSRPRHRCFGGRAEARRELMQQAQPR